ncbi:MAG: hypothetical protein MR445_08350 [Erysipelotrichaceae bacterium]|nr:hypothetical protein [Erysipelotrichaceae bacterium]MDY4809194.1 hypothetical protein [Bulleidia sp.]
MNRLVFILLEQINHEAPDSVDYIIAFHILRYLSVIRGISIQNLADACMVSKSTISRFCRKIGYEDYNELMDELNRSSDHWHDILMNPRRRGNSEEYLLEISQVVTDLHRTMDYTKVHELARDIATHSKVYVMGSMQAYLPALQLQEELCLAGKVILAPAIYSLQTEAILHASEDDLFIIFSNSGQFFDRIFVNRENRNVMKIPKIWMITGNTNLKEDAMFNRIIYIPNNMHFEDHPLKFLLTANIITLAYEEYIEKHPYYENKR